MNLNQITIKSQDVNRAVRFYQKLGLRLIVDSSPRYVRFECPTGDSTFSVSYDAAAKDVSTTLYFELKGLDKAYKRLKAQGINFTSGPQDKDYLWREARLNDPDGHPLVIFSAGKNRKNPPWKVKAKQWFEYLCESPVNLMK
ncbi:hypothetical protein MNBD_GAMMA02-526 [hydrothermal vent metagenome]|uniref:VOC domain-containing protein n=1 Tax=hydrothermal vent metagenome TaxID=652676 RepID=A0A3B0VUK8_9ZZZZ